MVCEGETIILRNTGVQRLHISSFPPGTRFQSKKGPQDKDQVKDRLEGPLFKLQVSGPGLAKGLPRIVGHRPRQPASQSKRGAHLKEPTMNAE